MRFRNLVLGWGIGAVLWAAAGSAWGQFQAVTPVGPVGPAPVVPIGPIGGGISALPQTPNLTPATGLSGLTPVGVAPSFTPPRTVDTRPTAPEPPEVRQNPPVLPYHRDDDKLPREGDSRSKDDPLWMYRALDKVAADQQHRGSQWQPPQAPTDPPAGHAAPPPPPAKKAESSGRGWWILAVIVVLVAFSTGRRSRAR